MKINKILLYLSLPFVTIFFFNSAQGKVCSDIHCLAMAEQNDERSNIDSENKAIPMDKFDLNLRKLLRDNPPSDGDTDKKIRITVKTTDRGKALRDFLKTVDGQLGSCHGPIITAIVPYRSLLDIANLESVLRIEGNIVMYSDKES